MDSIHGSICKVNTEQISTFVVFTVSLFCLSPKLLLQKLQRLAAALRRYTKK